MGILKIFTDKMKEQLNSVVIGQALPQDIRRDPGGKFEVQPEFQYPDMAVPEYMTDVAEEPKVSDEVQSTFKTVAYQVKQTIDKLSASLDRVIGLDGAFTQQGYDKDFKPLIVSYQTSIKSLEEIYNYFDSGANGQLNLKLSQVDEYNQVINQYVVDSVGHLEKLMENITYAFNYAKQNFDLSRDDARTFSWEAAYAIQVVRDQKSVFDNYLNRQEPEVKEPVQIPTPSEVKEPVQIPTPSEVKEPVQIPTPKSVDRTVVQKPVEKPKTLDVFEPEETRKDWKKLEDSQNEKRLESIVGGLPEKEKNRFLKWLTDPGAPQDFIMQLEEKGKKILQVQKDTDRKKLIRYRITEFTYDSNSGNLRLPE